MLYNNNIVINLITILDPNGCLMYMNKHTEISGH